ncbi:uncharacterized protein [Phyllobates terribilis]|uniref:uncharacterized protein isoform X3 n=1 Tax=Phyllobates terribilis TaxID=111132 RepID=UPI003CCAD881
MSAALEELLGKVRAAALVRGEAWLREKVAEILADEGKALDAQDPPPCAKRVRSLERRSPSPVPRNRRKVSSPRKDHPEASAGQCPSSEVPSPAEYPFRLVSDLPHASHNCGHEDLRIPVNATSQRGSENGQKCEDAGIVCKDEQKCSDGSGQHYSRPSPNPSTVKAETCDSSSNGNVPDTTHYSNAEEESIELRIERLLRSCSAAIMEDQEEDEPSEPTTSPVSSSVPGSKRLVVWIIGHSFIFWAHGRAADWFLSLQVPGRNELQEPDWRTDFGAKQKSLFKPGIPVRGLTTAGILKKQLPARPPNVIPGPARGLLTQTQQLQI